MAYDTGLADRIQRIHGGWAALRKQRMFGGLVWMLNGHMVFGLMEDALVVRCGLRRYADCRAVEGVREFDLTGKVMQGWVVVPADLLEEEPELRRWMRVGLEFAASLPPKG